MTPPILDLRQPPATPPASHGKLTPEGFFARAARLLPADPPEGDGAEGDHRLNPDLPLRREWRQAAVLVPLIDRPGGASVLLTQRTEHLSAHAGQIAFPGGTIDACDATPAACALREAEEEIGLDPALVAAIGWLPPYLTGTGYRILPLVARVADGHRLRPNLAEVAAVFEVPLSFLMTPGNHRRASRVFAGRERHFFEMPYEGRHIWGATAGIIRSLYERVLG